MKYGVIGTGWITEAFIRSADTVEGMELAAVYSRKEETARAFAERLGREPAVFTDMEQMAQSGLDGVYIANPNRYHYTAARLFLEKGVHVICEKPAVVTAQEMESLLEIAREQGVCLMEALMMLYLPERQLVKDALQSLGEIHSGHVDFSQRSSKYPAYLKGERPNIFNPDLCTGGLMDLGIYCVYPILDWFGVPETIRAQAAFLRTGADHSGSAIFGYPDKVITMSWSKIGQGYAGTEIIGDNGALAIDSISQFTGIRRIPSGERSVADDHVEARGELLFGEADRVDRMAGEARAFFARATGRERQPESERTLMRAAARVMEEIRAQAGIRFAP